MATPTKDTRYAEINKLNARLENADYQQERYKQRLVQECMMAMSEQQEMFRRRARALQDIVETTRRSEQEFIRLTFEQQMSDLAAQSADDMRKYEMDVGTLKTHWKTRRMLSSTYSQRPTA